MNKVSKIFLCLLFLLLLTSGLKAQNTISPMANYRILLIGDSQTAGAFGTALSRYYSRRRVERFIRVGEVGWGVSRWHTHRIRINSMLHRHQPNLILIELGGNDFYVSSSRRYPRIVQSLWNYVRRQAENNKRSGTVVKFCWISPATAVGVSRRFQPGRIQAARVIQRTIGVAHYVESGDITDNFGRTPDGLHFTTTGGIRWVRRITPRINRCIQNQTR